MKGERIGVAGSTMEANAALRTIVRRDSGETYREMLKRMAKQSGVKTPTIDDLIRLDRKRKGKKLSNEDWRSQTDPDAKIARMKDGSTHLAYKPEYAVDLDTDVIVAAPIHAADQGDTTTLVPTLETAARNLADIDIAEAEGCWREKCSATSLLDFRKFRRIATLCAHQRVESAMYFRRKSSAGRAYLQIVESRRDGDQVRQQVNATLGVSRTCRRAAN